MTTSLPQQSTSDTPEWGAAPAAPGNPRRTAVAIGAAVAVAAGGGVAIWAASGATDSTDTAQAPGGAPPGGGVESVLRGQFVATGSGGGYVTEFLQTGKVTALGPSSLTAVSDDGFSKTYALAANAVPGTVATGDTVTVVATVSGDTATATSVREPSAAPPGT